MQYLADNGVMGESLVHDRQAQLRNRTIGVTICDRLDRGTAPAAVADSIFGADDSIHVISTTMRAAATAYCPWTYQAVSATWPRH
ncbi:DUF732 domain-containing protein [Mycobacterium gordonae]|uniref:DUF732 domain-containing protein n=1 Tax=Mycobacterium gordonae TaxID=1778 RepID=UPI003AFFBA29